MASQGDTNEKEVRETHSGSSQPHPKGLSHKKKKLSLKKKLLLGSGCVILLILIAGWSYISHLLGKINRMDFETISAEDFVEETDAVTDDPNLETLSPEEITLRLANQVLKDKDVLNILLIGQDTQPGVSGSRSDSMILATVNQKKKAITITSFMRDLYVDIPGYKKSRLNTAYALGGAKLLNETIERNFGIHIDGNIAVNFTGFARCVDIIGGVDLEMTAAEAGAVNNELFANRHPILDGTDLQADRWALAGGFQHLTGDEALQYARIRKIDSDFSRTNRQRKLLAAVFEKLKNSDLKTMNALLEEVLPLLSTDIPNTKLIGYAAGVLAMQPATFQTDRIPADGAFREAVVHQMQVLVPDLEKNQLHLKESLYGSDSTAYEPLPSTEAPDNSKSSGRNNRSSSPRTSAPTAANPGTSHAAPSYNSGGGSGSGTPEGSVYESDGSSGFPYESSPGGSPLDYGHSSQQPSYQYGPGMPATEPFAGTGAGISGSPASESAYGAGSESDPGAVSGQGADSSVQQDISQGSSAQTNPAYGQTAAYGADGGQAGSQGASGGQAGLQGADGGQADSQGASGGQAGSQGADGGQTGSQGADGGQTAPQSAGSNGQAAAYAADGGQTDMQSAGSSGQAAPQNADGGQQALLPDNAAAPPADSYAQP